MIDYALGKSKNEWSWIVRVCRERESYEDFASNFSVLVPPICFLLGDDCRGMFVNYYYAVPSSVQSNFNGILLQIFSVPSLFTHVLFAVLSTGMSIPVIILARSVRLNKVILLHAGAMTSRRIGFIFGPFFVYFQTSAVSNGSLANISTFIMASVFLVAVILTFLSRIFIVREDVRLKYSVHSASRADTIGAIGIGNASKFRT